MIDPKGFKKLTQVDSQMIVRNLSLTFQQRIENHQDALDLLIELKKAGKKYYAKSQRTSKEAAHI